MRAVRVNTSSNAARVAAMVGSQTKTPIQISGCKGAIEPSNPKRFKLWVYIADLNMTTEFLTNDIEQGKAEIAAQIESLRQTVPARMAAFERLDAALKAKFGANLHSGYLFLNSQQKEWRSASTARLIELCGIVESLASAEEFQEGAEAMNHKNLTLEKLRGEFCPHCGKTSWNGNVHLRCLVERGGK